MGEGREEDKKREEGGWRVVFWNVAGLRDKAGIFGGI